MHILTAALMALATLAVTAPAVASSVTTNEYYHTYTDEDIAKSCKDVSVASSTGVVSATCNHYRSSTSDEVDQYDSTYDLDNAIYCKCDNTVTQLRATMSWGDGSSGACPTQVFEPADWSVSVSSDGKNYMIKGTCKPQQAGGFDKTVTLDMGDTSNGLKNSSGSLAAR